MKSPVKSVGRLACLLVAGLPSACDIPTDAPKLEQDWVFPLVETTVEVGQLLPPDVGLNQDSTAFTVAMDPISFREDLGSLCQVCAGLDGLTAPKPAFTGNFQKNVFLPDDVESAEVQAGRVAVEVRNTLSFDPLRPPGGERGSFTLALRDGGPAGPVLDQVVVHGEDTGLGPGTTLTRELEYSGPVSSTLSATVTVESPAGGLEPADWILIDLDDGISVTLVPELLEATSAVINVGGEVLDFGNTNLDVENISQEMVDRVVSGSFELGIVNPWSVGGVLNLTITGPTMSEPVVLTAPVSASPTSKVKVDLTQAELQAFLGETGVVAMGQGNVSQDAGSVTLIPHQVMTVDTRLYLIILIG